MDIDVRKALFIVLASLLLLALGVHCSFPVTYKLRPGGNQLTSFHSMGWFVMIQVFNVRFIMF